MGEYELKKMYIAIGNELAASGDADGAANAYVAADEYGAAIGILKKYGHDGKAYALGLENAAVNLAKGGHLGEAVKLLASEPNAEKRIKKTLGSVGALEYDTQKVRKSMAKGKWHGGGGY